MSEQTTQQEHASVPDIDALVASDSKRYVVLSNGAVKDMRNGGKFVTMDASRNPYAITKENAQEMHKLRRERTREHVLQGIAKGAKVADPMLGIEVMSQSLTEMVIDKNSKAAEQFRALLQAAGLSEERGGEPVAPGNARFQAEFGAEFLERMLERVHQRMVEVDSQVIDV